MKLLYMGPMLCDQTSRPLPICPGGVFLEGYLDEYLGQRCILNQLKIKYQDFCLLSYIPFYLNLLICLDHVRIIVVLE
jgi:hypothetical protein